MRLSHLVLPAIVLLAACSRRDEPVPEQKDVPVTFSRGNTSAPAALQSGDVRIISVDSGVDLAMIGDTISGGLSEKTLAKVKQETDSGAVKGSGFAASLERTIKSSVQSAIGTRVNVPLSAVRDVRYEGGKIAFEWNGEKPNVFGNVKEGKKDFLEAFRPEDAQHFVEAVRARKRARGGA
jgi:hypothetical protein